MEHQSKKNSMYTSIGADIIQNSFGVSAGISFQPSCTSRNPSSQKHTPPKATVSAIGLGVLEPSTSDSSNILKVNIEYTIGNILHKNIVVEYYTVLRRWSLIFAAMCMLQYHDKLNKLEER